MFTDIVPIWLDCDPGHDDAFAILLAAHHPALHLLGISTVHGNAPLVQTTRNAGRILTAIGRPDVFVYAGASTGLLRPPVHADSIHGLSGLNGTDLLPEPATAARPDNAIRAMATALLATPPLTAWLIATGALTNIALLFQQYPHLALHLKGLSIMGGAVGGGFTSAPMGKVGDQERMGNWTPYAEFNIVVDPEAAKLVLENEVLAKKTALITLDLTHQVLATDEVRQLFLHGPLEGRGNGRPDSITKQRLRVKGGTASVATDQGQPHDSRPSDLRRMLVELLKFFAHTYAETFGISAGPPLHDPLAVAVALADVPGHCILFDDIAQPRYCQNDERESGHVIDHERYTVSVVTDGTHEEAIEGLTRTGQTVIRLSPPHTGGVMIPRGIDQKKFWAVMEECIQRADAANAARAAELALAVV